MDLSSLSLSEINYFSEFHEENEIDSGDFVFQNFDPIQKNKSDDDLEDLEILQGLESQLNFKNLIKGTINTISNDSNYNIANNDFFHFSDSMSVSDKSIEKDLVCDYSIDLYKKEGKKPQIIEEDNNKLNNIKSELKTSMPLLKKKPEITLKVEEKSNNSKAKFSNNSKNSTKSSSNSNNNCLEKSMFNNKKARFKVLKSLKIPERFNEINLKLDMSCHNIYYEKKKDKIKKKTKKDYNIKDIKMENYEKPLIRQFKKFIKSNMVKYKGMLSQDKHFWDLFLGNKNEKYTQDEIMYKRKRFDKYNQKFLHYLFRRNDIKELYNNDFKAYCRLKNIKTTNDKIIYHFYSQYFDDLYKEEIPDIHFNIH